jgi:hypothetical protein
VTSFKDKTPMAQAAALIGLLIAVALGCRVFDHYFPPLCPRCKTPVSPCARGDTWMPSYLDSAPPDSQSQ